MSGLRRIPPYGWLIILIAAAFLARAATSLLVADNHAVYFEYMLIAQNLLDGKGYSYDDFGSMPMQPTVLFPPLYVYWCALFMAFCAPGHYLPMYLAQGLVAATGVIPAFLLGKNLFSVRAGWIFAGLYAMYPEMVFMHTRPAPESLYVSLVLWIFYLYRLLRDLPPGSGAAVRLSLVCGVLFAAGAMLKDAMPIIMVACAIGLVRAVRPVRSALRSHILPAAIVFALAISPWVVRNYIVEHRFIPLRFALGQNLWKGNHLGASGTTRTFDGVDTRVGITPSYEEYLEEHLPADNIARDDFYQSEAVKFIRENPGEYLRLSATRLLYYLWLDPTHPLSRNVFYWLPYVLLMIIAIPGIVLAARHGKLDPAFVFTFFGLLALYVPIVYVPRYRIISVVLYLLFAAHAIDQAVRSCSRMRNPVLPARMAGEEHSPIRPD